MWSSVWSCGTKWWVKAWNTASCNNGRHTSTSTAVTYPLDVIRRRMQMKGTMSKRFPYLSTTHALVTIYHSEGVAGFYKGMLPNLLKVAPSVAIAFVSYEITKAKLFGVPISWK